MKQAITYLLLFTYSTIILKPIFPYTSDFIAHIFWYKDHMATVHSHNGKFHVHKEVIEASKKGNKEKESALLKKDLSTSDHLTIATIKISSFNISSQKFFRTKTSRLLDLFNKTNYPPPKSLLHS